MPCRSRLGVREHSDSRCHTGASERSLIGQAERAAAGSGHFVLSYGIASIGFWHPKSGPGNGREGRSPRTPSAFAEKYRAAYKNLDEKPL